MNKYLAALKGRNSLVPASGVLQELQEAPFLQFLQYPSIDLPRISRLEQAAEGSPPSPAGVPSSDSAVRIWRIRFRGLEPLDVWFTPPSTAVEVRQVYPGAEIEPLPGPSRRTATAAEAKELRGLIGKVLASATDVDREEALAVACADPEAALTSFRALAAELQPEPAPEPDDRRACRQCTNLSPDGRCRAAGRGELPYVTAAKYSPVPDVPRRCEGYRPKATEADQRAGTERWPSLVVAAARVREATKHAEPEPTEEAAW